MKIVSRSIWSVRRLFIASDFLKMQKREYRVGLDPVFASRQFNRRSGQIAEEGLRVDQTEEMKDGSCKPTSKYSTD